MNELSVSPGDESSATHDAPNKKNNKKTNTTTTGAQAHGFVPFARVCLLPISCQRRSTTLKTQAASAVASVQLKFRLRVRELAVREITIVVPIVLAYNHTYACAHISIGFTG